MPKMIICSQTFRRPLLPAFRRFCATFVSPSPALSATGRASAKSGICSNFSFRLTNSVSMVNRLRTSCSSRERNRAYRLKNPSTNSFCEKKLKSFRSRASRKGRLIRVPCESSSKETLRASLSRFKYWPKVSERRQLLKSLTCKWKISLPYE